MNSSKLVNLFDYLSMEPKLFVNGNKRYSTQFGALMTIASFSIILAFTIIFIFQFYNGRQMNVLYYTQNVQMFDYEYNFNNKIFAFQVQDGFNTVDQRYLNIVPLLVIRNLTTNKSVKIPMEYEPCQYGKNIDRKYIDLSRNDTLIEQMNCIKPDTYDLKLSLNRTVGLKTFFNIYVQICQNSTLNNNTCFPREKIIKYLNDAPISLYYYYHTFSIDLLNRHNPLQDSYYVQRSSIFYDFKYVFYEFIKLTVFESDSGSFFDETIKYQNFGRVM